MARLPRLALGGLPHLVVQRGHPAQPVFADDTDRQTYRDALAEALPAHRVALLGYVLLDAAAWLVLQPSEPAGLSRALQGLGRRFVAAVNRRHGRSGTPWDGRFRAAVVDPDTVLLDVLVHVESKPVDAGMVTAAGDWPWSSASHHLGRWRDARVADHPRWWTLGNTPFEREAAWRRRLETGLSDQRRHQIDDAALHGWALGPPAFLSAVAEQAGRPAVRRARGRPPRPIAQRSSAE